MAGASIRTRYTNDDRLHNSESYYFGTAFPNPVDVDWARPYIVPFVGVDMAPIPQFLIQLQVFVPFDTSREAIIGNPGIGGALRWRPDLSAL